MSDIYGTGYGSNHNWKRGGTNQVGSWGTKATVYKCADCNAIFTHYYDHIPDIFVALEDTGVSENCPKKEVANV